MEVPTEVRDAVIKETVRILRSEISERLDIAMDVSIHEAIRARVDELVKTRFQQVVREQLRDFLGEKIFEKLAELLRTPPPL